MNRFPQLRIVLVGRSGDGMTSTRNTILEKNPSKTEDIQRRTVTVVETPGLFDTKVTNEEIQQKMVKCISKCTPGPHAILIILKVGRYTAQEERIIAEIKELFGKEVLKYSIVVFTNGDQLEEGRTIRKFIRQSKELQDLADQCGGRVHVIDNKYWTKQQEGYRSNRVRVAELLNTIEKMVQENGGKFYTNEMLQVVRKNKSYGGIMRLFENVRRRMKKHIHARYCAALLMVSVLAISVYYYNYNQVQ